MEKNNRRIVNVERNPEKEIGMEAYWYTYPLVLMDLTRQQMTNIEGGKMPGRGPMMVFTRSRNEIRNLTTIEVKKNRKEFP